MLYGLVTKELYIIGERYLEILPVSLVVLMVILYTLWVCTIPLPSVDNDPKAFKVSARYSLLTKWGLFLISGVLTVFVTPLFSFFAIIFFALSGWQMQCAKWELKARKNI